MTHSYDVTNTVQQPLPLPRRRGAWRPSSTRCCARRRRDAPRARRRHGATHPTSAASAHPRSKGMGV